MVSKTDILVYIDWYLPGYKAGGPIRSLANMVAHLQEKHRFHIITRDRDYMSHQPYDGLERNVWLDGPHQERIYYCSPDQMKAKHMRKAIEHLKYEQVYINGLFSWHFSIKPLRLHRRERAKLIVAPRGMLRSSALSIKGGKKKLFLGLARRLHLFDKIRFHATDHREMEDVTRVVASNAEVAIAPNLPRPLPAYKECEKSEARLRLVFVGRIAPEKNLKFALECLRGLANTQVSLDIFGARYDEVYWKQCKRIIESMPEGIQVEYGGTIASAMIMETLPRYDALFLPTRGENFGHIILESWMASRPVLISDQTPWTDIDLDNGGRTLSLESQDTYRTIIQHWANKSRYEWEEICQAAYSRANRYCSDAEVRGATEALFSPR